MTKSNFLTAVASVIAFVGITLIATGIQAADKALQANVIVLNDKNVLVLNEEVSSESAGKVFAKAQELDQQSAIEKLTGSKKPIYLFLYTPGGSIMAGMELTQNLQSLNRPVNTITQFAASMGFQIVQGLGERNVLPSGVLMSHHAAGGVEGEMGGKHPNQLGNRIAFWENLSNEMDQNTVARTKGKQTMASYLEAYDHELWSFGNNAVAQGYADRVVQVRCDDTLKGSTTKTVEILGGMISIDYDLSNCPLNSAPTNIRPHIATNHGRVLMTTFVEKNGGYGVSCLELALIQKDKICALDSTIDFNKIDTAVTSFVQKYNDIKARVIPMKF